MPDIGCGVHLDNPGVHLNSPHLDIPIFTTSIKTPFPNKVTFTGY